MKTKLAHALWISTFVMCSLFATDENTQFPLPSEVSKTQLFGMPLRIIFQGTTRAADEPNPIEQAQLYSQAMELFITRIYNAPDYAQHISQDGTHVTEFVTLADEFGLNIEAVYTGLRLFYNKYKEAEVIDDTVVLQVLDELPAALEPYFPLIKSHPSESVPPAKVIENLLLGEFTDTLSRSQMPNEAFFKGMAEKIASFMTEHSPEEAKTMRERLRTMVVRFIDQLFSKMMWYPTDYQSIWNSVISCAHNVHLLAANQVITHADDVDDLLWTLVLRFKFFLEQCGSSLPQEVFQEIRYDIDNGLVSFLETPELDHGIKSKKAFIIEALTIAETKSIAFKRHGIISDEIID